MAVLGINDSHDAGAAVVEKGVIDGAINEERFTKRKNEVGFPYNSIRYLASSKYGDGIDAIALGWIGGNALISRVFPSWDRKRRALWRRELPKPSRPSMHVSNMIYKLTQNQNPKFLWRAAGNYISRGITMRRLGSIDGPLSRKRFYIVEHHMAHAASAYYPSGFKNALIITLDGAGDGLSGTVSVGDNGEIRRLAEFKASASLGIFFGAATVACDMRYSEDEGKLMSLAAYSYPAEIEALSKICRYDEKRNTLVSNTGTRNEILLAEYMKDHILSKNDRESFAYAVQRHLEKQVRAIASHWIKETGLHNLAVAGGLFSNVIVNRMLQSMPEVEHLFIFPQMGDGGLSAGAAAYVDFTINGKFDGRQIQHSYFGPEYSEAEIEKALRGWKGEHHSIEYERVTDPAEYTADLVAGENKVVLWFQGRMEYGPRALGNRSVIAMPNDNKNREIINLIIKKRPYYQPFASTILEEDAKTLLEDYKEPNRFMTVGNKVREGHVNDMIAAAHVDSTTRPQILGRENTLYRRLIEEVRKRSGIGAVLNTSLNKHGKPIAMSPEDALWTLDNTGATMLMIGNYLVRKKGK